jgi:hypothetical protein
MANLRISLTPELFSLLQSEARERGLTANELTRQLLQAILQDRLVKAVLS